MSPIEAAVTELLLLRNASGVSAAEIIEVVRPFLSSDAIPDLPWKREKEGRAGDRFEHEDKGVVVTVESQADGNVYYRSQKGDDGIDRQNTIEEWHRLVTKAMDSGKVIFTPSP